MVPATGPALATYRRPAVDDGQFLCTSSCDDPAAAVGVIGQSVLVNKAHELLHMLVRDRVKSKTVAGCSSHPHTTLYRSTKVERNQRVLCTRAPKRTSNDIFKRYIASVQDVSLSSQKSFFHSYIRVSMVPRNLFI